MPAILHIYVLLYFYYSLHIDPLLHTSIRINEVQHLFTNLMQHMYQQQIKTLKYHTAELLDLHQWGKHARIYATYKLTDINHVTMSAV